MVYDIHVIEFDVIFHGEILSIFFLGVYFSDVIIRGSYALGKTSLFVHLKEHSLRRLKRMSAIEVWKSSDKLHEGKLPNQSIEIRQIFELVDKVIRNMISYETIE